MAHITSQGKPISKIFQEIVDSEPDLAIPVATIKALTLCLQGSEAKTISEFTFDLFKLRDLLIEYSQHAISVTSGCELFTRFVSLMTTDDMRVENLKSSVIERGLLFVEKSHLCREKISDVGLQFIQDGCSIMIHSYSKVVMQLLQKAVKLNKRFKVFVTEARPSCLGIKACKTLQGFGIPCQLVLDAAVGYFMGKVDMILVGAEGVVENGGLINQIGTYQISIMAKEANKPFYALAESYKFVRLFPLDQYDLPSVLSSSREVISSIQDNSINYLNQDHPLVDYTPPSGITLLFTDLGVLTPSGVSDELIKFHYGNF